MSWYYVLLIIYAAILVAVCMRIVYETLSPTKTMAYLLLVIFVPVGGILFYLAFGVNYWKMRVYKKKMGEDEILMDNVKRNINRYNESVMQRIEDSEEDMSELAAMLIKDLQTPLMRNNTIDLLINGEQKFPQMLKDMAEAREHIHIEYYIFEQDEIGSEVIELLIKKAKEGVKVRFMYDDFGSPSIKKKLERRMREAGVEVNPFHKVLFYLLANRLNYRNHRKIVVIDGHIGYVGGINVSDKYHNNGKRPLFWRDTHLRICGDGVYYLQYLFLTDWNFCCPEKVQPSETFFPPVERQPKPRFVQIVGSGPDSIQPSVLFSVLQAIFLAREEILITTPYFIPGESVVYALRIAALSGLKVILLVPGKSDSVLVNKASQAYYEGLLLAGVEIYLYQKGFVHAKTLVADGKLAMVGTANMDHRSFELNFEVNAIVYDNEFAQKLRRVFFDDLQYAKKIDPDEWFNRSFFKKMPEKFARLLSPAL